MRFLASLVLLVSTQIAGMSMAAQADAPIILDVRTPSEYRETHLQNAVLMDFKQSDFKDNIQKLDKDKTYQVYCRSGNRSGQATELMKSLGFKHVEDLGGLKDAARKLNQKCEGENPC